MNYDPKADPMDNIARGLFAIARALESLTSESNGHVESGAMTSATFGERLRQLRESKGKSKAALARALGSPWSTINNWELHDAIPNRKHIDAVGAALGLDKSELSFLLDGRGDMPRRIRLARNGAAQ